MFTSKNGLKQCYDGQRAKISLRYEVFLNSLIIEQSSANFFFYSLVLICERRKYSSFHYVDFSIIHLKILNDSFVALYHHYLKYLCLPLMYYRTYIGNHYLGVGLRSLLCRKITTIYLLDFLDFLAQHVDQLL